MTTKLHPEVEKFIKQFSSHINVKGERWYHMPYWLKKSDDGYDIILFEHIPDYVQKAIQDARDGNVDIILYRDQNGNWKELPKGESGKII